MKISIRKTKKEEWLVFEAIPVTMGIGVNKVGSFCSGYTTGLQFGKFSSELKAKNFAARLIEKSCNEFVEFQPPQHKNQKFIDLLRLYPLSTEYNSKDDAEKDGWVRINPSKVLEYYKGVSIRCVDVTPGRGFGYNLAIKAFDKIFTVSNEIGTGEYFSIRFRAGDIVSAIEKAKDYIDSKLK